MGENVWLPYSLSKLSETVSKANPREIIEIYRKRWLIELLFK